MILHEKEEKEEAHGCESKPVSYTHLTCTLLQLPYQAYPILDFL